MKVSIAPPLVLLSPPGSSWLFTNLPVLSCSEALPFPNTSISKSCSIVAHCPLLAPRHPLPARQCSSPASCRPSLTLKSLVTALAKGNASDAQSVLGAFSW
ncbi:hypothetical protein AHAS_Ahas01G0014600 [Arachis hypogaea]